MTTAATPAAPAINPAEWMPPTPLLELGTPLGPYTVDGPPRPSALGAVYPARDSSSDAPDGRPRLVALWLLPDVIRQAGADVLGTLERHTRAAARIRHPVVARPLRIGRERDIVFMALEYEGGPHLESQGAMSPLKATYTALSLAQGLSAIHAVGLCHGDVRPANVRLTAQGQPRLLGTGLSRAGEFLAALRHGSPAIDAHYVGPELSPDLRSDIYALGATYYRLLTGRPPYDGLAGEALAEAHRDRPVPHPRAGAGGDIPEAAVTIIARAMAKAPRERYPTAAALAADLQTLHHRLCQAAAKLRTPGITLQENFAPPAALPLRSVPGVLPDLDPDPPRDAPGQPCAAQTAMTALAERSAVPSSALGDPDATAIDETVSAVDLRTWQSLSQTAVDSTALAMAYQSAEASAPPHEVLPAALVPGQSRQPESDSGSWVMPASATATPVSGTATALAGPLATPLPLPGLTPRLRPVDLSDSQPSSAASATAGSSQGAPPQAGRRSHATVSPWLRAVGAMVVGFALVAAAVVVYLTISGRLVWQ